MKISVIMPSFLGPYPGAARNRPQKFVRAIDSFLEQTHKDAELIIISDGCEQTIKIAEKNYTQHIKSGRVKLFSLPRHELFTGAVRQAGIDAATGDVICNLDTDDTLMPHHLANIRLTFRPDKYDWAYFNHSTKLDEFPNMRPHYNDVKPELGSIGNGNIAWKRGLDVTWKGCDGKHDNQSFISQLINKYPNKIKLFGCGYTVRHATIKI